MRKLYAVFFLFFLSSMLFSQIIERISKEKEFEILSKEIEGYRINSPLILQDRIIFFYRGDGTEKKVVVAGDFTEWKPLLLMERKSTNMWQYVWDERLKRGEYRYKLLVDDIWIGDPQNTNFIIDDFGEKVSFFVLEEDLIPEKTNPLWIDKDIYEFKYYSDRANSVSLVGNFNNWNPYRHILKFNGAGEFSIRIRLKPGLYVYCFVVDEKWIPDPLNLKQYKDSTGNIVSVFYAGKKKGSK
ncbi:MAG: glycogen-binding domain-containing protein [Brevinematia bacterium]